MHRMYSHTVQSQNAPSLGERLDAFMRRESAAYNSVASGTLPDDRDVGL
jgi:hypothetical protein